MNPGWLPLGEAFQGYTVDEVVGVGGMSVVYRVHHDFLGKTGALKVLKIEHASDKKNLERARHEAVALSRLQHANLVPVLDAGMTTQGMVWMVMPLLDGLSLRDYLNRRKPSLLEALRIAREVADGASAAHELGIIHRDLKPENVFVTREHQIIVLDLGMAKFQDFGLTTTGGRKAVGTVRYMSPEQLRSQGVDVRTDVYAVGMMLYEMIGGHPFEWTEDGQERVDKFQMGIAQLEREPRPLREVAPSCPEPIAAMVHRAITKDRHARFPTMADFSRAIRTHGAAYEKHLRDNTRPGEPAPATWPTPGSAQRYVSAQTIDTPVLPGPAPTARVLLTTPEGAPTPVPQQGTEPLASNRTLALAYQSTEPGPRTTALLPEQRVTLEATGPRETLPFVAVRTAARPGVPSELTERFSVRGRRRGGRWVPLTVGATLLGLVGALGLAFAVHRESGAPAATAEAQPQSEVDAGRAEAFADASEPAPQDAARVPEEPALPSLPAADAEPAAAVPALPSAPASPGAAASKGGSATPPKATSATPATSPAKAKKLPTADWRDLPPEDQPRW